MVEHFLGKEEVARSIRAVGTKTGIIMKLEDLVNFSFLQVLESMDTDINVDWSKNGSFHEANATIDGIDFTFYLENVEVPEELSLVIINIGFYATIDGVETHFKTNSSKNALKVFGVVKNVLSKKLSEVEPDVVLITVDNSEPERLRVYNRMLNRWLLSGYRLTGSFSPNHESKSLICTKDDVKLSDSQLKLIKDKIHIVKTS